MKNNARRDVKNALLNLLFFPGLGSLRSGRWVAGTGQIISVLAGTALMLTWLFKVLSQYYGLMYGDVQRQSVAWMGWTGAFLFALSWLWAGITSLSLFRAASQPPPVPPVLPSAPPEIGSTDPAVQRALASLPDWQRRGQIIARTFEFADFPAAMKFVNAVAGLAEQAQHHPDIDIRWNRVTLALTTHDAGGLTEKDFALARECDALGAGRK
jgi:4a-hydroxytetrahydrobiopterin dehydratase